MNTNRPQSDLPFILHPSSLLSKAKALLKTVRAMFRKDDDTHPLKAPWPPGVDVRKFRSPDGVIYQLRPGGQLPRGLYLKLSERARDRASAQSASPCPN